MRNAQCKAGSNAPSLMKATLLIGALSIVAVTSVVADTDPRNDAIGTAAAQQPHMSASGAFRVAVGYCIDRCHRQFEYCRYRQESHEYCRRQLVSCLAAC